MASISSLGTGSGLDLQGLLTKLMAVEQQPLTRLATKEAVFQAKLSAYGSLKGTLSSLQTSANTLSNAATFTANTTTQSDSTYFSASASSSASAGNYSIEVKSLAKAQTLATSVFSDTSASVGTGTLSFQFGTASGGTFAANAAKTVQTVTIDSAHNSLAGIRDAINTAGMGVSASIVNDGSGYRLLLSSNETGTNNTLKISTTGSLSSLAYDPAAGSNPVSEIQSAADAVLKVNGLTVTKSSNTITDAVDGLTLNLKQAEAANTTVVSSLTVARNTDAITSALQGFVKAYNDTEALIKSATAFDATNKTSSTLTGDTTTRSIESQMRALLGSSLSYAGGGLQRLSDVGITFQKDGTLSLDTAKLTTVLKDPSKDISSLFASVAKTGDSNIKFASSTSTTKPGVYDLNLTSLGMQSSLTGSGAGGSLTLASGSNDVFTLAVNGTSDTITLSAGTYTAASLAAEVQSKINSSSALKTAGALVTVTAGSSGKATGSVDLSTLTYPFAPSVGKTAFDVTFGGSTSTVTLGAGSYATAAQLQAGIQSALNTQFGAGALTASLDSSNKLVITDSTKFGAASTVSIAATTGDTLYATLFGTATSTAGTEMSLKSNTFGTTSSLTLTASAAVTNLFGSSLTGSVATSLAGTLGGAAFTSSGQTLTGTGAAAGLALTVLGGATGARGQVSYDTGFGARFSSLIDGFIGTTGLLASRTDGINRSIKDLSNQTDALNIRLTAIQARYTKQFTALDASVASMQNTASYLTQQLSSLSSLANYTVNKTGG